MEILLEDIRAKFDLVLEGHAVLHSEIRATREELNTKIEQNSFEIKVLSQKIDSVEQKLSARIDSVEQNLSVRIDSVEQNLSAHIDSVATDLAAHRRDTERHSGYRVSE